MSNGNWASQGVIFRNVDTSDIACFEKKYGLDTDHALPTRNEPCSLRFTVRKSIGIVDGKVLDSG